MAAKVLYESQQRDMSSLVSLLTVAHAIHGNSRIQATSASSQERAHDGDRAVSLQAGARSKHPNQAVCHGM